MASSSHFIGAFDNKTGRILTREEQETLRRRLGHCTSCGKKTHARKLLRLEPLTIEGEVYKGQCLTCNVNVRFGSLPVGRKAPVAQLSERISSSLPAISLPTRPQSLKSGLGGGQQQHHRDDSAGSLDSPSSFDVSASQLAKIEESYESIPEDNNEHATAGAAAASASSVVVDNTVRDRNLHPIGVMTDTTDGVEGDDAISDVVRAMRAYPHSAEVQLQCCYNFMTLILPGLSSAASRKTEDSNDDNASKWPKFIQIQHSGVQALCDAIENHSLSQEIQQGATKALWALLSMSDEHKL